MQYQVKQDFVGGNNSSQGNSIAVNHSHALSAETVDQSRSASTMNSIFSDHNNFKPTFQRYQGASNYTLSSLNDSAISSPAPARPLFGTANHPQLPSLASIGLPSLAALSARGSMPPPQQVTPQPPAPQAPPSKEIFTPIDATTAGSALRRYDTWNKHFDELQQFRTR